MEKNLNPQTKTKQLILAIGLVLSGILLTVFAIFPRLFSFNTTTASAVDKLSNRSKEFIENQKLTEESDWKYLMVDSEVSTAKPTSYAVQNSCFSTVIPIPVQHPKSSDDLSKCSFSSTIPTPASKLIIVYENRAQSLDQTSSVILRQRLTDEYTQLPFAVSGYSEVLRFESKDSFVTFLRKDGYTISIAFSSIARQSEAFAELTDEIIANLKLSTN